MHYMNKAHGEHMTGKKEAPPAEHDAQNGPQDHGGGGESPDLFIKSHAKGTTVHIMHSDGRHEAHEHGKGDAEGVASHIHEHIGGEPGQDHGGSSGHDMEDEYGLGGPTV